LEFGCNFVGVIAMVNQNGNFGDVHGFGTKVIEVAAQQFNQALVIANIGFRTVSKKRQAQRIDRKVAFDAICAFVMTEPFRLDAGITGILHRNRSQRSATESTLVFFDLLTHLRV